MPRKVINISQENYDRLLEIATELQKNIGIPISFNYVVQRLLDKYGDDFFE
jgi:hypothetical protein